MILSTKIKSDFARIFPPIIALASKYIGPIFLFANSLQALDFSPPLRNQTAHYTSEFIAGHKLYYDPVLSGDKNLSCASCHSPLLSRNVNGLQVPPLANLHHSDYTRMFWNGRLAHHGSDLYLNGASWQPPFEGMSLVQSQILMVLTNPREMLGVRNDLQIANQQNQDWYFRKLVMRVIGNISTNEVKPRQAEYRKLLADAFPATKIHEISFFHISRALETYAKGAFRTDQSRWDLFLEGKQELSPLEQQGAEIFRRTCLSCHRGQLFSDFDLHSIKTEFGSHTCLRTPPLRNVEFSGPYGFRGKFNALEPFLRNHGAEFVGKNNCQNGVKTGSFFLDSGQRQAVVSFLRSLSSSLLAPEFYVAAP